MCALYTLKIRYLRLNSGFQTNPGKNYVLINKPSSNDIFTNSFYENLNQVSEWNNKFIQFATQIKILHLSKLIWHTEMSFLCSYLSFPYFICSLAWWCFNVCMLNNNHIFLLYSFSYQSDIFEAI